MQNGPRQKSFLPDRSITYSTASSFYGRDEVFDLPPQKQAQGGTNAQFPPEILLRSYTQESLNGGITKGRRVRAPSLSDPIQTHLLLQTALGDSGEFEVLSLEELEDLKKEAQSIRARIGGLQRKLALETKVRDAARSLARLHSTPSSTNTSPRLNRRSSSMSKDSKDKAQLEFTDAQKKVDGLARELYNLEWRERQVQTRILQHTAGILQNTHHGYSKTQGMAGQRPDSPASLDGGPSRTASKEVNGFDALLLNDDFGYDDFAGGLPTAKVHKRQQSAVSVQTAAQQREMMMYLANGLQDLNKIVTTVLGRTNPQKAQRYNDFPDVVDDAVNITFAQQLDHLSQGLQDIGQEQAMLQQAQAKLQQAAQARAGDDKQVSQLQAQLQESLQENLTLQQEKDQFEDSMTAEFDDINNELYDILSASSPNLPKIPPGADAKESAANTKERVANIKNLVQSSSAAVNEARQTDAVMQGLWVFILGAEEDLRDRKRKERQVLAEKKSAGTRIDSEDEVSPDEDDGLGQDFSIPAFNTKVQWLVSQSLYLKEKSSSLRRKVKAHRERADRSIEDMAGNDGLKAELDRANQLYATAKDELRDLESRSSQLQKAQSEKDARIRTLEADVIKAETEARETAQKDMATIEAKLQDAQQKAAAFEKDLAAVKQEREAENTARSANDEASKKNEAELAELQEEVVRLKTELTIAQAELEGAYGSRSQREAAMKAAANTEAAQKLEQALSKNQTLETQLADLQKGGGVKEAELRKELAETLKEFEELTKASVDQEREREELENSVDKFRDKVEQLEAQIAEDQVKWLGLTGGEGNASPGSSANGGQSMSVVVLKNEFKKMMKDARVESAKALRAEQDERRKLEKQLRELKKK